MIQLRTYLNVADNSGAKRIMCFGIKGGSAKKYAFVGDEIIASVKEALPNSDIKPGQVVRAVVVRTKKEYKREDGSLVKFDDNAAVLIDAAKNPKGTRVFGPVANELRKKNYTKIISLAPEVI